MIECVDKLNMRNKKNLSNNKHWMHLYTKTITETQNLIVMDLNFIAHFC